ncbi:MAG: glycosidase [Myxococcales bacterium]|nr:glycosidase [Myxococcales bacterium]
MTTRSAARSRWLARLVATAALALASTSARAQAPTPEPTAPPLSPAIPTPGSAIPLDEPGPPPPPVATRAVEVARAEDGVRLLVEGRPFLVQGVNWDYFPIGTNYNYSLWTQPDDVIVAALANEMTLLKRMGVNAIRVYAGIPRRWIQYIHDQYGIYTVLNHTVGRYGYTLDGAWVANVDYSSPKFRAAVKREIAALVDNYKGTPGLLMWLYGNENNYGLSWSSFEIEALPAGERDAARARFLYSLLGEIIRDTKARDPEHPVAIANGDLQYIDVIAQECQGLDVFGANVYRGKSMGDLYDVVKAKLDLPVMFTEFGADAFDARRGREDDLTQATYLLAQWREIYEHLAGQGLTGNAIGGLVFQWSDGWWKYKQEINLDRHDTNASWPNRGYPDDFVEGGFNMNEEWWGLCAKGQPDARGLYELQPRTAFYALKQAYRLAPYAPTTTPAAVAMHFDGIDLAELTHYYKADQAAARTAELARVRLLDAYLVLETYQTGGDKRWARPDVAGGGEGFDHTETLNATIQVQPTDKIVGTVELNLLGHVAANPIDEIFYERRGRAVDVVTDVTTAPDGTVVTTGTKTLSGLDRIRIYKSAATWDDDRFRLDGFFRSGHYHWAAEGDLFGLYREANYGTNVDVYDADAPAGVELTGKRELDGLKLALGPQLWWGANPALLVKYRRHLRGFDVTAVHQEDLAQATASGTSAAVPERSTRKTTLALERKLGSIGLELAGIWAGSTRVDDPYLAEDGSVETVLGTDSLGAKAKITYERGPLHWYAQAAYMGLVADAGPDARLTFTGWTLKDSGSGNQVNVLTGFALSHGDFQIAPNLMWQRPLVGPGPSIGGNSARNIEDDPFAVRGNRETVGGELMLVYDPTPATWMWAWDNDLREDASFAASLDVAFRHQPTTLDAGFWFAGDGVTRFAWDRGVPAADVWEAKLRLVGAPRPDLRLTALAYAGNPQAFGQDGRQPNRYGAEGRVTWRSLMFAGFAKFNDWGPFDYYRDFNSTLPLQLMGDVAYTAGPVRWLWQRQTRFGVRVMSRYLNGYSGARFVPDPTDPTRWGHEYEIRTYLNVAL